MRTPPYLKKGDKIGIVACARKISLVEIQPAVEILKSWGLEVVFGKNLFKSQDQFSGSDLERTADLQGMLDDISIKAVVSARGGYGTLRIIDNLNFTKFSAQPKWVIGYSDITVLHSHIHNMGIETLHATMPINFTQNKEAVESLRKALFGETMNFQIPGHILNKNGKAEGEILGGNLSLLYALQGSVSDITTQGKILFLEDLDEYLYHIDRMILSLKRSGKLSGLAGLVIGGFTDMKDNVVPFGRSAEEIIRDSVKEYEYPVCFNFPAGHIGQNMALYMGRRVFLTVTGQGVDLKF